MLFFKIPIILCLIVSFTFCTPISIIVSNDSSIDNISKNYLKNLFLSKTKQLPNGKKAIILEPNDSKYNSAFYKNVTGKTEKQLNKYWATMIFTGRGQPAKKVNSIMMLIDYVKNNPNAITYVPTETIKNNEVKILLNLK